MSIQPIQPHFDHRKADAFAASLLEVLNHGAMALMTSIGHRAGLFDTMRELPPSTSSQIATAAGLNERYVREWLGAMVVGGFVECYAEDTLFYLPPEHARSLTRSAGADNMAVFAQYFPILGAVEDKILDCFRRGGGLQYDDYPRFHAVMAEDSGQSVLPALLDGILPMQPGLLEALQRGIDVLDIGCGRGRALNLMARAFPRSRFTGMDVGEEALAEGRAEAERHGTQNIHFLRQDVARFEAGNAYDLITAFDAIHDQAAPDVVLRRIATALRPQGTFLMQDIAGSRHVHDNMDHPLGPVLYTISCLHCMSVSLGQDGMGLGAMWGEETALDMLRDAGFSQVRIERLPHDVQNQYYIAQA